MIRIVVFFISLFSVIFVYSQKNYWQQSIKYNMVIDFDHENHQFLGNQSIKYYNNSPDKINKVFMHLYYNAFQPGSMMDVRSRTIQDPDSRVMDRISKSQYC